MVRIGFSWTTSELLYFLFPVHQPILPVLLRSPHHAQAPKSPVQFICSFSICFYVAFAQVYFVFTPHLLFHFTSFFHFAVFYLPYSLFILTDHSTFEILLTFLFSFSLCASSTPVLKVEKPRFMWQVGKCFFCKYIHLHVNVLIYTQMLSFIPIKRYSPCAPFVQTKTRFIKASRKVGERSDLLSFWVW